MISSKLKTIAILVAMHKEAEPIVSHFSMRKVDNLLDKCLPSSVYQTQYNGINIYLVENGLCKKHGVDRIGTQAATLLAWETINKLKPEMILNIGTAGGFSSKGAHIGDVYLGDNTFAYHHRLMEPAEYYVPYGIGSFESVDVSKLAGVLNVKTGIISTGDSVISSKQEIEQIQKNNATLKDMEAAAIAEVAYLKNIPFIALKTVTDLVDTGDSIPEQFKNNFKKAIANLTGKCVLLINALSTNSGSHQQKSNEYNCHSNS